MTAFPAVALANATLILPAEDPHGVETHRVLWAAEPGIRYELQESEDLAEWDTVAGFPTEATALAQQHAFEVGDTGKYFRVRALDEQAPEIVWQYPEDGAFAVGRFAALTVELWDATGIAVESIALTVGDLGTFFPSDAELSFVEGLLVFDAGGGTALGAYGETITVYLHVSDSLGNGSAHEWMFDLERETVVSENLFVFGSPEAQQAGQQFGDLPLAFLAQQYGGSAPLSMADPTDGWTLERVKPEAIVLRYEGETAPTFLPGTYLANLTPASLDEIFYRQILDVIDDPDLRTVTLRTQQVGLDALVSSGSLSLGPDSMLLTANGEGVIVSSEFFDPGFNLPTFGVGLDGAAIRLFTDGYLFQQGPFFFDTAQGGVLATLTAEELHWWWAPSARAALEINSRGLERFEGVLRGTVHSASVTAATFHASVPPLERKVFEMPQNLRPRTPVFIGMLGPVPVYAIILFNLEVTAAAEAAEPFSFRAGMQKAMRAEIGMRYQANSMPPTSPIHNVLVEPPTLIGPESVAYNGNLKLKLTLRPTVSFLVYGLAGAHLALKEEGGLDLKKDLTGGGRTQGRFEAAASLALSLDLSALKPLVPDPIFTLDFWSRSKHLFPLDPLSLVQAPGALSLHRGEDFLLSMEVNRPPAQVTFQWYHNGTLLPPGTQLGLPGALSDRSELRLYSNAAGQLRRFNAGVLDSGLYRVVARSGDEEVEATATVDVSFRPTRVMELAGDLAFGYLPPGQSDARTLIIRNRGDAPLNVTGIDYACPVAFSGEWAGEIPPGGMQLVEVTYAPFAESGFWGEIAVQSDATGGRTSHPISGTSLPGMAEATRIIDLSGDLVFGTVGTGTFETRNLVVTNLGNSALTISGVVVSNAAFSASASGTIQPGASMSVAVTFTPMAQQSYSGQILVNSNATGGQAFHALAGIGFHEGAPVREGFAHIPAGVFAMGDHKNETEWWMAWARPVHSVHISAFEIAQTSVSYAQWKVVYDWAVANGYTFDNPGQRGSDFGSNPLPDTPQNNQHPVTRVSWFDVIKWCNAKSEMEGLTPVYYTNNAQTMVYRQGRHGAVFTQVSWSANGYRLPTEAEWEKAARGGLVGKRWVWGDEPIDGTRANYWNSGQYGTTAVGSYPANGYGLYDMAGNVWEWNWDWFSATWYSQPGASEADSLGPDAGSNRVVRGGGWNVIAAGCRVAYRVGDRPGYRHSDLGFRPVRRALQ